MRRFRPLQSRSRCSQQHRAGGSSRSHSKGPCSALPNTGQQQRASDNGATKSFHRTVTQAKGPGLSVAPHQRLCQCRQLCLHAHTVLGRQGHPHCLTEAAEAALWGKRCCPSPGSLRAAPTASCHHSSSASCLTMNLTALTKEESSQHPIPTMQR